MKRSDLSHVDNFLLDILRGRGPQRWYATADLSRILNAERKRDGKPPIRPANVSASLRRLREHGLVEARQVIDNGRIRNEWRAAPKPEGAS